MWLIVAFRNGVEFLILALIPSHPSKSLSSVQVYRKKDSERDNALQRIPNGGGGTQGEHLTGEHNKGPN